MASLNFEQEKTSFREYYNENQSLLEGACSSYKTLVSLLLADNDEFPNPVVTGRVKNREECIAKFALKYQKQCEERQETYEIKDYIADIVGVRVVCLYESDISLIRNILDQNFEVVDVTDKITSIESNDDTFGYKGLHLDLKISKERLKLPEYKRFVDLPFEVQIRTTVQDAWSVLDHKIKYKKTIPQILKRRINRMAALFELADQEFQNIRDETTQLEKRVQTEMAANKKTSKPESDVTKLTPFTFMPLVEKTFPTYRFESYKVDGFVHELTEINPLITTNDLEKAISAHKSDIGDYCQYQVDTLLNRLNPYTTIRHYLYLYDKDKYQKLLFDLQRNNFEKWFKEGKKNNG